jgi:excisionase family DNA binding protein
MKLMTYEELSKEVSLCIRSLQKYVKKGELPCVRFGRSVRFRPDMIAKWLDDRSRESNTHMDQNKYPNDVS